MGATPGIICVLHTWGQQLSFHPHIHCIVSGGGIFGNKTWKEGTTNHRRFLFPVKAMSIVDRAKFLQGLQQMITEGEAVINALEYEGPKESLKVLDIIIKYRLPLVFYTDSTFSQVAPMN